MKSYVKLAMGSARVFSAWNTLLWRDGLTISRKRGVKPTESQIQSAFVDWVRLHEKIEPRLRLSFSVPNGSKRNIITATILKREGVRRGIPDWMCPVPINDENDCHWSGLAIEFKRDGGRVTPEQKDMIMLLREHEWSVYICYSTEEAIACVKRYFDMK